MARAIPRSRVICRGFTLVELLVVIGIIIILMGILLPVVAHIRIAVYKTDTQNEIDQIASACNQYYATFNAYPGPFSNDQIEANTTRNPTYLLETYNSVAGTFSARGTPPVYITGSENLVLGLMGGLRQGSVADGITWAFSPTEVGLGPLSLNPAFPSRTPTFFPNGTTYLLWCEKTNASGNTVQSNTYQPAYYNFLTTSHFADQAQSMAKDSFIPEFVDRFPSPGPLPILYLRARTGAKGVVSFYGTGTPPLDPTTNQPAQYQYDLGDINAYTTINSHIGLPSTGAHYLNGIETPAWPPNPPVAKSGVANNPVTPTLDAFAYFANKAIAPTNTSSAQYINNSARPRAVDQFILISAGPDEIYGTADDITSFGDVSQ